MTAVALLLSFVFPFLIALLSGMGVGGGGLFVIYLRYISEFSQLEAQTQNLVFFIFAALSALMLHLQKRKIFFGAVVLMSLCGIVGSVIGSATAFALDGELLKKMFGILLIAAGSFSFFTKVQRARRKTTK